MKMKKLLAAAMAATMILSSMVTSFVASAATVGKITAGDVTVCPGKENTVSVDVEINFDGEGVKAPHNIVSVAIAGYDLKEVTDIATVKTGEGDVIIDEDGSNLAAGKILFEAPVDSKAPTVKQITFTAVFEENGEEKGTEIVVNGDDMTDVNEAEIGIDAKAGVLTIAHAYEASVTAPTCTAQGFTTHTCACGETYIDTYVDPIAHSYVDGKCTVCGADDPNYEPPVVGPTVDSALVVAGASVGYGTSSLQVGFRVRKAVLQLYDSVELVIVPQKYDTATLNLVANPEEIVAPLPVGGAFTTYTYTDIQLYELGLNIDYMLRAYDEAGNLVAVSESFSTSAASFLKSTFATSTDALLRTLITDTLVVGAKSVAGTAANYPDSDLAKATSIIDGFDISEATPSVDTYNTVDVFNSYNASFTTATSATHRVSKSVTIGKVPYIGFRVKDAKSALEPNKFSFKVSYTKNEGKGVEVPYEKTFTSENTTFTRSGQFITFSFDEIGLQDGNKDIAIELYYDGAKVADLTYSIETYLGSMMSNATVGELTTSLIKLGISFRAYANA